MRYDYGGAGLLEKCIISRYFLFLRLEVQIQEASVLNEIFHQKAFLKILFMLQFFKFFNAIFGICFIRVIFSKGKNSDPKFTA